MLQTLHTAVDGCFCINLRERTDRRQQAQACFDEVGLTAEFHEAEKHSNGGEEGCYVSHQDVMRKALDRGYKRVLICEDDLALLNEPTLRSLHEVIRFLKGNDWDILYLGTSPLIVMHKTKKVTSYSHIRQVRAYQAHAYIVSERWMRTIVHLPYHIFGVPIDVIYANMTTAYCVFPMWFYQTDSPSDIDPHRLNKNNWMRRLQMHTRTAYAQYINLPLYWVVLGLAIAFFVLSFCLFVAYKCK